MKRDKEKIRSDVHENEADVTFSSLFSPHFPTYSPVIVHQYICDKPASANKISSDDISIRLN